jgi:FkbM family methyltransferase
MYFQAFLQHLYPFGHGRKKLLRWLGRSGNRMTVARNLFGQDLLLDRANFIDGQILQYGNFEHALISRFCEELDRAKACVFLDIGANLGLYCLSMARLPGIKRVVAFEPDPRNFMQLAGNVFLNDLSARIEARSEALSDKNGTATFYVNRGDQGFISAQSGFGNGGENFVPISVVTARLDDLVDISGETVGVKIDVEGFESQVLDGMARILAGNKILMQIEIFEENVQAVHAKLEGFGLKKICRRTPTGHDYLYSNFAFSVGS